MGAEIYWKVRVVRTVEDTIEIKAVTETEAEDEAAKTPHVLFVQRGETRASAAPDEAER